MSDFDDSRGRRRLVCVAAVLVVGAVAAAGGVWFGRSSVDAAVTAETVAAATVSGVASPPPPWPATITSGSAADAPAGTADAGWGWQLPEPGASGPFSVTDLGVPFGYRQDPQGAAVSAVNAVVAGKYLATTFPDPWAALGFLADPRYAERGGNPDLERFFSGPVIPSAIGATTTTTATTTSAGPAAAGPGGGGRVIGVRVEPAADRVAPPGEAMQAVVLWESFNAEYRVDGQQGYTVRIEPIGVQLVWVGDDWKVSRIGPPPSGLDTAVLGVLPEGFPVPAEQWHR
jgi:hypothetical protein